MSQHHLAPAPSVPSSDLPTTPLYHYTSLAKLLDIVRSGGIWSTDLRFLNDKNEYRDAVTLLIDILQECVSEGSVLLNNLASTISILFDNGNKISESRNLCYRLLMKMQNPGAWLEWNIYTVSFSVWADDLSQWRAYARPSGVALGFLPISLQFIGDLQGFRLRECIYDDTLKRNIVLDALKRAVIKVVSSDTIDQDSSNRIQEEAYNEFMREFQQYAATFKDKSFSGEKEWRLISDTPTDQNDFKFHSTGTAIIPHRMIDFSVKYKRQQVHMEMPNITIGPTNEPNLNWYSIYMLFWSHRSKVPQLHQSTVPYREAL